jgi:phosphoglucomutase
VVGGDGRFLVQDKLQTIICMAAANGVRSLE